MFTIKGKGCEPAVNVQGFQKLTLLDFPGKTSCTVFCGGCNLRCPFCHNATLVKTPFENKNNEDELFEYLEKRKGILDGVCITGGEPLLQVGLKDFILRVKAMGYKIKLDTNGALPKRLKEIIGLVDYVAMDIKAGFDNYALATGSDADTELFKESIYIIKESGIDHEFRTTLVKGLHTEADVKAITEHIRGEKKYFLQKFKDSGNLLGEGEGFSEEEYLELLETARKIIPETEIRG